MPAPPIWSHDGFVAIPFAWSRDAPKPLKKPGIHTGPAENDGFPHLVARLCRRASGERKANIEVFKNRKEKRLLVPFSNR